LVKPSFLSRLALFASFFALGVIALGAFTRLIDAGLGCPDWPGCYGHLTAPLSLTSKLAIALENPGSNIVVYKAWAEMIHRYFVGGLSIFILGIIATILSRKIFRQRNNIILAFCLLLLLVYQIVLGQLTVTLKLLPVIVSQHLLGGFLILATLWMIHLQNNAALRSRLSPRHLGMLLPLSYVGLVLLLIQIALGAWTSTNYASLSCPDFPFCMNDQSIAWHFKAAFNLFSPVGVNYEGGVLPETIRQTIQMTHRLGALVVTSYLFLFSIIAMPKLKKSFELMKSFHIVLGLLCLQLCIGITNVMFKLPLVTAVSHNLVAVLLLLAMITLIFKLTITQSKARTV
jgi:cytochrome c oxidase assembly protein subunit 15